MIHDYLNSLFNYQAYPAFLTRKKSQVFAFSAFVILVFWVLTSVVPLAGFRLRNGSLDHFLSEKVPEFSLSGGRLSVDQTFHYANGLVYVDINTGEDHLLDPEDSALRTVLDLNDAVVLVDSEKLIFKADAGGGLSSRGAQMVRFSDISDFSFDKAALLSMAPVIRVWIGMMTMMAYVMHLVSFFVGVLSIVLISDLFARISHLKLGLGARFRLAAYSRSLPLLVKGVLFLSGISFAEFPALSVLYSMYVLSKVFRILTLQGVRALQKAQERQETHPAEEEDINIVMPESPESASGSERVPVSADLIPPPADLKPSDSWSFGGGEESADSEEVTASSEAHRDS